MGKFLITTNDDGRPLSSEDMSAALLEFDIPVATVSEVG